MSHPPEPRRTRQLRGLTEVSRALTYATSLDEVLSLTVRRAADLLDADRSVLLLTNDDGLLSVRASHNLDQARCERFREPLQETLTHRLRGVLDLDDAQAFLAVPLVVAGEVTGVVAVARSAGREGAEEDEWLLSALADQAAVALEKSRLDEAAEFRERLIGIVSHDLRNPIHAIAMGTELLLGDEALPPASRRVAMRIRSATDRASRMVRDLLDYTQARLGTGVPLTRTHADLGVIVHQVVDEASATRGAGIEVRVEGDASGHWDADRLAQVVENLLGNAIRYGDGQGVRVEVDGRGDDVALRVRNGGTPIDPRRLASIFEPMERLGTTLGAEERSVGLGLYIVRHVVERHDGHVTVVSDASATSFEVRLPRTARGASTAP